MTVVQAEIQQLYDSHCKCNFVDLTGRGVVKDIMDQVIKQQASALEAVKESENRETLSAKQIEANRILASLNAQSQLNSTQKKTTETKMKPLKAVHAPTGGRTSFQTSPQVDPNGTFMLILLVAI